MSNMEKLINKKIETYVSTYKNDIRSLALGLEFKEMDKLNELMEFVFEYTRLVINKDEFAKRRRTKNDIPGDNRCTAKISNGEQCTRRKKTECEYCGTHSKGIPHGSIALNGEEPEITSMSLEVVAIDIGGIIYYVDSDYNVFKTEDIMMNKENPRVVAKAEKINGKMTIPALGIFSI
jgi:hypothetical protein